MLSERQILRIKPVVAYGTTAVTTAGTVLGIYEVGRLGASLYGHNDADAQLTGLLFVGFFGIGSLAVGVYVLDKINKLIESYLQKRPR